MSATMAPTETGRLDRMHLLKFNEPKIDAAYLQAQADRIREPVVFVLDLRDSLAIILARSLGNTEEQIRQLQADSAARNEIPTVIAVFPLQLALQALDGHTPSEGSALRVRQPTGTFWAVAIAAAGVSYALKPISQGHVH